MSITSSGKRYVAEEKVWYFSQPLVPCMLTVTWQEGLLSINVKLMNVILPYRAFSYCTADALYRPAFSANHKLLLELKITT